jgi:KaiC/GvpD/RAD55 family RecA-like ATPase
LIRLPNTKHEKSKLYKIPLTKYELADKDFLIKFNAKKPRASVVVKDWDTDEYFGQANLMEEWSKVEDITFPEGKEHNNGKISEPNSFINAIEATTGGRHEKLTKILGYLIDKSVGFDNGLAIAKNWNKGLYVPMSDERLLKDVKGIYKSFWDKRPKIEKEPTQATTLSTNDANDISKILVYGEGYQTQFLEHIARLSKGGRIGTGYKLIDDPIRGMIAGEVMTIVGKTSVGKSAFVHNILLNNVALGRRVLFFSLEMPLPAVAERTLQRMLKKSGQHIEESFLKGDSNIETDALQAFQKLDNFVTIPKQGIDYAEIEKYIIETEEYFGEKFDIVAIDYAGLIKIDGDSLYAQQSEISRDMKALSGRTQTSVITLAQVSKQYGINDVIDLDATRDSGVVTEASDYVLGLWRAQSDGNEVINLHGNVCKNRNGRAVQYNMEMNRTTLKFVLEEYDEEFNTNDELF